MLAKFGNEAPVADVPVGLDFGCLGSWLDYRMKRGAGRTSSPLDEIRPHVWSFDEDLLDLLWVLEATLARHDRADDLLGRIVDGDTFRADAFPQPTQEERKGPDGKPAPLQPAPLFDEADDDGVSQN